MSKQAPSFHPDNRNWRLHYADHYRGYAVLCNNPDHGALIQNQLDRLIDLFERVRHNNQRTLAVRFDLYIPNDPNLSDLDHDSRRLKRFWRNLNSELEAARLANPPKLEYAWAREIGSTAHKTHFHMLIFLDANSINSLGSPAPSPDHTYADSTLAHRIIRSWLAALDYPPVYRVGNLINFQKEPHDQTLKTIKLTKSNDQGWHDLFYLASYLCKSSTKEGQRRDVRTFETSRA